MGIFLNDAKLEMALLAWLSFFGLALLGWLLMQLIHWENAFQANQAAWLRQLRKKTRQLRTLRRATEKAQDLPGLPLPPALSRKWRMVRWVLKALSTAQWARS